MSTKPLVPGIGISFCDGLWHAAVASVSNVRLLEDGKKPVYHRDFSGSVWPNESVGHTVGRILNQYVGRTPEYVGVSTHHDSLDSESWREFAGTHIETVDPTAATLAGLEHVKRNPNRLRLRPGAGGGPQGLLKVGPHSVTWIVDGEKSGQVLTAATIKGFSPAAQDFAASINAARQNDPVQLLGNLGWVNAARYLAQNGTARPDKVTRDLMNLASTGDQKARRDLVARLCWLAPQFIEEHSLPAADNGEAFADAVANFMFELLGRSIGYIVSQKRLGTLFVQYNSISGSDSMRGHFSRTGADSITRAIVRHDKSGEAWSKVPEVVLVEPRPWMAEAYGAILLAGQKVGAAV
jgi:hypothetical protein